MLLLQIMSVITAGTLVLFAVCVIPVLMELKRTAVSLRTIAETMQGEINPLIKELRDTVADVQVFTSATAAHAEGVNLLLEELGHAGHNIRMINKIIGIGSDLASFSSTWATGARVAGKVIIDRLIKKRG
jgi:hypothetical protein